MNRLAQALICLTDPAAKKAYDLLLLGKHAEPVAAGNELPPATAPSAARSSRMVRLPSLTTVRPLPEAQPTPEAPPRATPPSLGRTPLPPTLPPPAPPQAETLPQTPPPEPSPSPELVLLPGVAVPAEPPPSDREKEDPVAEAARSRIARRGLGTKRALYQRIVRTRQLLRLWDQSGRFLAWPKKRLSKAADAAEMVRLLGAIRRLLRGFPPLLGEAGQPGYLVMTLARQQAVVPTFQTLIASQRESLARDWWAGRGLLEKHRDYLRQEVRRMPRKNRLAWAARATAAFLTDQPGWVLLFLALVALNIAIWRTFFPPLP
jgi:hypothetical protein